MGCATPALGADASLPKEREATLYDVLDQCAREMNMQLTAGDRQFVSRIQVQIPLPLPKFLFLVTSRSFDYAQALSVANFNSNELHFCLETPLTASALQPASEYSSATPDYQASSQTFSLDASRHIQPSPQSENAAGQNLQHGAAPSFALISALLIHAHRVHAVSLNLTRQPLSPDLTSLLAASLDDLKALSLVQCGLNADRCSELSRCLMQQSSLEYLNLSRNPLTDRAGVALLQSLKNHFELAFLGLAQTYTRDLTVRVLVEVFARSKLRFVDLSDNAGIGRDSVQLLIILARTNGNLCYVNVLNSSIQSKIHDVSKLLKRNYIAYELFYEIYEACLERVTGARPAVHALQETHTKALIAANDIMSSLEKICVCDQQLFTESTLLRITQILTKSRPRLQSKWTKSIVLAQAETMGRRQEMEDVVVVNSAFYYYRIRRGRLENKGFKEHLVCLFDGHGGRDCSTALGQIFPEVLADALNSISKLVQNELFELPEAFWEPFMSAIFDLIDKILYRRGIQAGSTAAVVLFLQNLVVCANCGDSRVVLCRGRTVARNRGVDYQNYTVRKQAYKVQLNSRQTEQSEHLSLHFYSENGQNEQLELAMRLSVDHKPSLQSEVYRIQELGGFVYDGRLQGLLAVARSFGDFDYKPFLTASPFVRTYDLCEKDYAVVVACDGVWDVISDFDSVVLCLQTNTSQAAAIKIRDEAYKLESQDNISCVVARIE